MATNITGGRTTANSLVFDPNPTDSFKYNIQPLITAGDQVSLITGDPLATNLTTNAAQLYAMPNVPDGLGFKQINGLNYVWMNHELSSSIVTDVQTASGLGKIQGARVSLFVFDSNWNAIGGQNLLDTVKLGTETYTLNTVTGFYESGAKRLSFSRFCSGYLADSGFVGSNGTDVPMWFMGEEDDTVDSRNGGNGYGLAVAPDGTATVIAGLGKYKKETVVSHTSYRANNSDWTVLLSSEDNSDGEMYMYVGKQTVDNPNGLWSDAGADGSNFALYVLRVKDAQGNVFAGETMAENQVYTSEWVEIPDAVALGSATGLSNWVNGTDANGVLRSTDFERLEDTSTDPLNANNFYFTTTGSGSANPRGKVHKFTANIDPITGKPIDGTFENLFKSGPGTASRYDNIVADSNGNLVVQTDGNNPEVGIVYNLAENANNVGNDKTTAIYELNVSGESSGIVEVSPNTAVPGQSSYLFDIQASQGQLILVEPTLDTAPAPTVTDTVKPTVNFLLDQSASDFNKIDNLVLATDIQNEFQLQLSDGNLGSGINPASVTGSITITKNGIPLAETVDYSFAYDPTSELITVSSLNGGFTDGFYQISASSIADNAGNLIDPIAYNLDIDTGLQFAGFQQGFGGYNGTVDTMLKASAPGENFSTFDSLNVDASDGGLPVQALIQFNDIFGAEAGQIPFNATITSANLELQVTNPGNQLEFYNMLTPWTSADTWNSLTNGIEPGVEVATTADAATVGDVPTGLLAVNVTNSLQTWQAAPETNNGWAILPTGTNGVDFSSAEGTAAPALIVEYNVNEINGAATNETLSGTANNDVIRGENGNDRLRGRGGDDLIVGGSGNDTIIAGGGNDVSIGVNTSDLNPGSGETDIIFGGATSNGADTIALGDKNNVFYATAGAADLAVIRDFDINGINQDKIQLKGAATDYSLVAAGANTNIFFGNEQIATIEGIAASSLNLANTNNFVYV